MTLTPCPACGHLVSPRATMCPKCGDPLKATGTPEPPLPTTSPSSAAAAGGPSATQAPGSTAKAGKVAGNATTTVVCVLLILAILFAGGSFLWREQKDKEAQAERAAQEQDRRRALEADLAVATERLEKLRAAQLMEFAVYGSRQFEEAPNGKGMFDTNLMLNGIPQRCVLVVKPARMVSHGPVTTVLKATKITRSQFNMTITARTGITSQQTDFYDVYEALEQDDLGRAEVRVLELKKQLSSDP